MNSVNLSKTDYEEIIDRAMLGTKINNPINEVNSKMAKKIVESIQLYINTLKNDSSINFDNFYVLFSKTSKKYNIPLRSNIIDYMNKYNNFDIVLGYLDMLFNFCANNISNSKLKKENSILYNYIINYLAIVKKDNIKLNEIKNEIYNNINILQNLIPYIKDVTEVYINFLDENRIFGLGTIIINDVSKNLDLQMISNIDKNEIKTNLSGELLSGKIMIESQRGYINNPSKPQQDAVLSVVKNAECYLNVIADGAGGSIKGEEASKEVIVNLKEWFDSLNEDFFTPDNMQNIINSLNEELLKIDNLITQKHPGSYSTAVIALTLYDKTLIANIGDSTAYQYDGINDKLNQITISDSVTSNMSYEEARQSEYNKFLKNALGFSNRKDFKFEVHYSLIDNIGQKIILSSDGVTDLVSEEKFKSYFKTSASAKQIVEDAVYRPDVNETMTKNSDNVSAIVINLPNYLEKNKIRRGI